MKLTLSITTALGLALCVLVNVSTGANAEEMGGWKPKWTEDDQLVLPEGYREWVFLGSPITPNGLNDGSAGFPEYHNVYVHPKAYAIYKETGAFAEGTILLKELQLSLEGQETDGSRYEVSGRGFFPWRVQRDRYRSKRLNPFL